MQIKLNKFYNTINTAMEEISLKSYIVNSEHF